MPAEPPRRPRTDPPRPVISRRKLLIAGTGGFLLVACGGRTLEDRQTTSTTEPDGTETTLAPDDGAPVDETALTEEDAVASGLLLSRVFAARQPVRTRLRLPLVLVDAGQAPVLQPPPRVSVRVGPDGGELGRQVWVERHDRGLPYAYFPLRTAFHEQGAWRIVVESSGTIVETVVSAVGRNSLPEVPAVGDLLPAVPTPTRRDPLGAVPLCSADPPCPLHETSLPDALDLGQPIALLVTSPSSCQTGVCASVLDLLTDARRAGLTSIHVEASTDSGTAPTPIVDALALSHQPALFLAGADGRVVERLDHLFDATELGTALRSLRS